MRTISKIAITFMVPFVFATSCKGNSDVSSYQKIVTKIRDSKDNNKDFGNFSFEFTDEDLKSKGYEYGDLLNLKISNIPDLDGKKVNDVNLICPLIHNYNEVGYCAPSLCNYQSNYDRPQVSWGIHPYMTIDYYNHFMKNKDKCIVEISMKEKNGYKKTLELVECGVKQSYDELVQKNDDFANFRDVTIVSSIRNKIKPYMLYRGSSPFNAKSNETWDGRHVAVDLCMQREKVKNEICLCMTQKSVAENYEERYKQEDINKIHNESLRLTPDYSKKLFESFSEEGEDKHFYIADSLATDYYSDTGLGKIVDIFKYISDTKEDESIYLHCNEGKDRTGFLLMLIEALCDCSLDEINADFMVTFKNYFNITKRNNKEKYETMRKLTISRHIISIMIDDPFNKLCEVDWYNHDLDIDDVIKSKLDSQHTLKSYTINYITRACNLRGYDANTIIDKTIKKFKKV